MFGHIPESHVHSPRRIAFRCAHNLWCDMNAPQRFHMYRRLSQKKREPAKYFIYLLIFVLSLQLHVCNVWQDAGNALDQPRGGCEREKLGTHLITGPHQMLELFTHQAWNFVCREMIYNFTLTAAGKQGERETEMWRTIFFSLCQQIPE